MNAFVEVEAQNVSTIWMQKSWQIKYLFNWKLMFSFLLHLYSSESESE